MTSDEAGRLQEAWKAKGDEICLHMRIVDYLESGGGNETGQLVCKECGAIFPNPQEKIG